MALADYFERNAQATSSLLKGLDTSLLSTRLEQEVIAIVVDASVASSTEGRAAVDLSLRLASRLYPTLALVGATDTPVDYLKELRALAKAINPKITIIRSIKTATRALVFGATSLPATAPCVAFTWYVGSDNWIARLSRNSPVMSGKSDNPLGAGTAACLALANVFRAVFATEVGQESLDSDVAVSLLDLRPAGSGAFNPKLGTVRFDDVHLAGAGAIGNGFLWAVARMHCVGTLHVVDPETVTDSNLQRYVMLSADDTDQQKSLLANRWLADSRRLRVVPHTIDWAAHISVLPDHKADTVVCAVDSADARIQIQASLPRVIYNGWTQRGEAGVSRHHFLGEMACMACLYLPKGGGANLDQMVLRALHLPEDEAMLRQVRQRIQQNTPTDRSFLELVTTHSGVSLDKLLPFENRPLEDLYVRGVCGGAIIEFHAGAQRAQADVPMGFQSALSGILLAAELARPTPLDHDITQIDLLGRFPERPGNKRRKSASPVCICADEDFREVYKLKYPEAAT
jgi:hypothetical protein